jgi:hypothetical protein
VHVDRDIGKDVHRGADAFNLFVGKVARFLAEQAAAALD